MPKKIKDEAEDVETTEEVAKPVKGEVTVTWRGGSRVYSKELHGAGFRDLAKEFAEKKGGIVA